MRCIKLLYRIANPLGETLNILLLSNGNNAVSKLKFQSCSCNQIYACSYDSGNIHSISGADAQTAQAPAIHLRIGNDNLLHSKVGLHLLPIFGIHLQYGTQKCYNRLHI